MIDMPRERLPFFGVLSPVVMPSRVVQSRLKALSALGGIRLRGQSAKKRGLSPLEIHLDLGKCDIMKQEYFQQIQNLHQAHLCGN